jgi:hypothetical protein
MRRRDFIRLVGVTTAGWAVGAHAQQPSGMRRIGLLMMLWTAPPPGT